MKRILTIRGGGIFGLQAALIIQELETLAGKPAGQIFDMIVGNSTGAIIATGLAAGVPASQLVELYAQDGPTIFDSTFIERVESADGIRGPKYSAAPLEGLLRKILGNHMLSDIGGPLLLVPATYCPASAADPQSPAYWFRSWLSGVRGRDFPLWQIARCSSAAPTYFPCMTARASDGTTITCVDGGLFCNNPEDYAVNCARSLWPGEPVHLLTLGTGTEPVVVPVKPDWGGIDWINYIAPLLMRAQVDMASEMADPAVRLVLDSKIGGDMDDASPENIASIKAAAAKLLEERIGDLDAFLKAA